MSRLKDQNSPYLRHAALQKIDWYPWSEEPFLRAKDENKPVFLSSGAVWCHWCHVMAAECFSQDDIATILNRDYICIKLDRDERPDIDRRYQNALAAMSHSGGWPLSIFLTHEKKPFFGGTYFPPEDIQGRPGFGRVLLAVRDYYRDKKEEISDYTDSLLKHLRQEFPEPKELAPGLLIKGEEAIMSMFDPVNGGFGSPPKFPMSGTIGFLLDRYRVAGVERCGEAAKKTLYAMARGGFHDQLEGGFHRYSVDEAWQVPHFEKMADDNAWLLLNYLQAYEIFGDPYFKEVAEGIIAFSRNELSDPRGGFFASQDADVTPEDEGGYFTWSEDELRAVLDDQEYTVVSARLLSPSGRMHHDKRKYVLSIASDMSAVSLRTNIPEAKVSELLISGKARLLEERHRRKAPFIDKTLYTSLNGLFISSCFEACRLLGDEKLKDFGLLSLERIVSEHIEDGILLHTKGIPALLDDYVYLAGAMFSAHELTGDLVWYDRAALMMMTCIECFFDRDKGGFFDAEAPLLDIRLKPVEDIPHPSANAAAAVVLLKLSRVTGRDDFRRYAGDTLRAFAGSAVEMGIHAGCYFRALQEFFNETV